jgi:predicted GIY-YIG superfamily endonuclease
MHESFAKYVDSLHASFERLVNMAPVKIEDLRKPLPEKCIYLFSENGMALYVGTTNHFRQRMRQHSIDASQHNQAVFAFRLARAETGKTIADYSKEGSRSALLRDKQFANAFQRAKARIRDMELRYVEETDPLRQALLEIYVAVVLRTMHNDFETH